MRILISLLAAILLTPAVASADMQETIDQLNANNSQVRTLTADVSSTVVRRRVSIPLTGKLYFERPMNFRLINRDGRRHSFTSDLGSNDSYFWFYAKRVNSSQIYFSNYSNLSRTRIKDSLNPEWIIDALNMSLVDTKDAKIYMDGKNIAVSKVVQSPRRSQVLKVIKIDPQRPAIVGHYLLTSRRALIASAEVSRFYKLSSGAFIPAEVNIVWPPEQVRIVWRLNNPRANIKIDPKMWTMPNLGVRRVNLGTGVTVRGVND